MQYALINICSMEKQTLKFPILSASMPARGGITIATTGVTADMMAVSSTLIPSSRIWIVKYGYKTNKAENKEIFNYFENTF